MRAFGATGRAEDLQTAALRRAIDACAAAGGGEVLFPAGTYLTGTLLLKSHVYLHLLPGAVIQGSADLKDYEAGGRLLGLIRAEDARDVGIFGEGVIDGNGLRFMDLGAANGGGPLGVDGPVAPLKRPGNMVVFTGSKHILVRGVTLRNSPYWTLHLAGSEDVVVEGLTVDNDMRVPNNDGIHMTSSRDIRVSDCRITTGDDAIAVSGVNDHGSAIPGFVAYHRPTENVVVTNCVLSSRSAGIRAGYGEEGVRNCSFDNIVIRDSNRGIGIFVRDKGSVTGLRFSNITVGTRLHSHGWWGNGEPIHVSALTMAGKKGLGRAADISFSHIRARGENGVVLYASTPTALSGLSFEDVDVTVARSSFTERQGGWLDLRPGEDTKSEYVQARVPGFLARNVSGLRLRDLTLSSEVGMPAYFSDELSCENVSGLTIEGFKGRVADCASEAANAVLK